MSKKLVYKGIFTEEMNDALHAMKPPTGFNPLYNAEAALEQKQKEEKERELYITAVNNVKKTGAHRIMSVMSDDFEDLIDAEMEALRLGYSAMATHQYLLSRVNPMTKLEEQFVYTGSLLKQDPKGWTVLELREL